MKRNFIPAARRIPPGKQVALAIDRPLLPRGRKMAAFSSGPFLKAATAALSHRTTYRSLDAPRCDRVPSVG
jgi:hypothetical protein